MNSRDKAPTGCSVRGWGSEGMTLDACLSELCREGRCESANHSHPSFLGGQGQHLISISEASPVPQHGPRESQFLKTGFRAPLDLFAVGLGLSSFGMGSGMARDWLFLASSEGACCFYPNPSGMSYIGCPVMA